MADITFTGNLGGDPEVRFTQGGKAVANFTVADTLRGKNAAGEWEDKATTWWRVQAWDRLAETLGETLTKGTRVVVSGTVHARDWEDKDGNKRTSYDVTAKTVGVIPKASGGNVQRQSQPTSDPWASSSGVSGTDAPF